MSDRRVAAARPINTTSAKSIHPPLGGGKQPARSQPTVSTSSVRPAQLTPPPQPPAPIETPACEACQGYILAADEVRRASLAWASDMRDAVDDAILHHADDCSFWLLIQRAAGFTDKEIFARLPPSASAVIASQHESVDTSRD